MNFTEEDIKYVRERCGCSDAIARFAVARYPLEPGRALYEARVELRKKEIERKAK